MEVKQVGMSDVDVVEHTGCFCNSSNCGPTLTACLAMMTSGTVDMPTTSAPQYSLRNLQSARVS